jgi:putative ABC transport system permease protein
MFKSYFKIAWRNLIRDRQFSFLNLVGLSTGLACTFMIYLWVNDELHVNTFNEKDKRLYQVMQNIPLGDGRLLASEATPGLLSKTLEEEMPEIEDAASVIPASWFSSKGVLSSGDTHIKASEQYVTGNFFDIFSYQLVEGDKRNVLSDKSGVLLSDELAMKLFHSTENSIGKTVQWDHHDSGTDFGGLFTVTGIFKKPLSNSTDQFDLLFNYQVFLDKRPNILKWGNSDPCTYVILKKEASIKQFATRIKGFNIAKNKALYGSKNLEWIGTLFPRRYSDKYLYNQYDNGVQAGGRIEYVKLFSIIALFILVIACINFMNLSTAKAARRIKEVGIKKVVGASRSMLVFQYLGESMLMTLLSVVISIVLVAIFLPQFNAITGKHLTLQFNTNILLAITGISVLTGLVAGSYPAFYLSKFKPVAVLKGKLQASIGELWARKGLVVFQFTLSVIFIIAVLVVYKQMNYIQTKNLGYNKDNIISFKKEGQLKEKLQPFLSEVRNIPGVINASNSAHDLTGDHGGFSGMDWEGKKPGQDIEFNNLEIDYNLMQLLEFKMAEGRMFSTTFGADSMNVIFNEAAIAAMELKDPIGKTITLWGKKNQIVGVVKNFNFESLHEKVKPCILRCFPNGSNVLVKIQAGKEKETITRVRNLYNAYTLGLPFDYKFLDDDYQNLYASEQKVAILARYFSILAIIISCLGLFGLATFTAQKRQKEIGIRKVVGATVSNVAFMLSKDFLKLVLIAVIIAFPVSWWALNQWLQGFAYRVSIGGTIFLVAGVSVILITLATISFQAIKAAVANPVKSLRSE